MKRFVLGAIALLALPAAAAAQSYGDINTSYMDGVVYDDDLVPGRNPNQDYNLGDRYDLYGTKRVYGRTTYSNASRRPNSPDLIGPDGRLRR